MTGAPKGTGSLAGVYGIKSRAKAKEAREMAQAMAPAENIPAGGPTKCRECQDPPRPARPDVSAVPDPAQRISEEGRGQKEGPSSKQGHHRRTAAITASGNI